MSISSYPHAYETEEINTHIILLAKSVHVFDSVGPVHDRQYHLKQKLGAQCGAHSSKAHPVSSH